MAFCEQCGAKLSPGTRFCEECGAAVENDAPDRKASVGIAVPRVDAEDDSSSSQHHGFDAAADVFSGKDWRTKWKQVADASVGEELGILLTDGENLLNDVCAGGAGGWDEFPERFAPYGEMLRNFRASAAKRGVRYYFLDLSRSWFNEQDQYRSGDIDSILGILRQIVDVARPKYLFILGGENVIPVMTWNDETGDDATVESDLPYVTLDTTSPWSGQQFSFKNCLRVGRLPSCGAPSADEERDFFGYFTATGDRSATVDGIGRLGRIVPYGLSALVWEDESNDEYSRVSNGRVLVSPGVDLDSVSVPDDANLLFFNLHGSDENKEWYGQAGMNYPKAFAPGLLAYPRTPYFLAVEACYGARYTGGLRPRESVLLTAMRNGCIAFIGSSRIAYGTPVPNGSCADVLIGEYIKRIADGDTAGDAYVSGLGQLAAEMNSPAGGDDSTVKTMAEFALYGDPSACTAQNKNAGGMKKLMKAFSSAPKGLHIPMPDVRRVSRMALAEVNRKIEALVDDFAMRELGMDGQTKAFGQVRTKSFRSTSRPINLKTYSVGEGIRNRRLRVYFDDKGTVTKALHSK